MGSLGEGRRGCYGGIRVQVSTQFGGLGACDSLDMRGKVIYQGEAKRPKTQKLWRNAELSTMATAKGRDTSNHCCFRKRPSVEWEGGSWACMVGGVSTRWAKGGEKGRIVGGGSSWVVEAGEGFIEHSWGRFKKTKARAAWSLWVS